MLPATAPNPFQRMPDEDICRIFENLKFQGLVACSLVSKRFYDCSNDTGVWKWVASKDPRIEPVLKYISPQENLSGPGIKRFLLGDLRSKIVFQAFSKNKVGDDLFVFRQPLPNLESWQKPLGVTLPLKFKDKHYFIYEKEEDVDFGDDYCYQEEWGELEIKNGESNETEKKIRLKSAIDTDSPIATDGEIFVYKTQRKKYRDTPAEVKFLKLTDKENKEKTLHFNFPKDYSLEIKKGFICFTSKELKINVNYSLIPLVQVLRELKEMEKNSHYHKPELMQACAKLPSVFQQEIYSHLCVIQGRQVSAELGEDAFHDRNGQSSTIAEKLKAVRRCLQEAELDALGYY